MTTDIDETATAPSLARGPRLDPICEARDWQGNELCCADCAHAQLAATGGCELKRACVHDRYARRIDRFFAWNPALAAAHLDHPYFEARAIATKYASVFLPPPLLADPDATVRWSAAARLPRRHLLRLREDPDREVRIRVAHRLKGTDLIPMMTDPDYYVRQVVVRCITALLLPQMARDVDAEVRRVVAERIDAEWLMAMAADEDARVRLEVVRRLPAVQLKWMQGDPDWRVRYELAGRLDAAALTALLADADPLVRERCRQRIEAAIAPSLARGPRLDPIGDTGAVLTGPCEG